MKVGLHSQVFFLTYRARAHRALMDAPRPVVQDRSFYEDAEVFARALHRQGAMSDRDWDTYRGLYRTLTSLLAPPDLVVYLRASVPTLQRRIAQRARAFEASISDAYLDRLNTLYEWIGGFSWPRLSWYRPTAGLREDSKDLAAILDDQERLRGRRGSLFHDGA
jgi:deoxyadenosine/deoxycytidine kinase